MAAWCSIADIRNADKKLAKTTEVADATVTERIASAQDIIITDLSILGLTEAVLDGAASTSKPLKVLAIYKTLEILLTTLFGNYRQVDTVSDIDYFRKKYDELLAKVISGEVILASSLAGQTRDYPGIGTDTNQSFYAEKGMEKFWPDDDTVHDTVNN
jgi:hypothetical protein